MHRFLTLALLAFSSTAFGQAQTALDLVPDNPSSGDTPSISPAPTVKLPGLPPMPNGKATEIGGAIRTVDQVRDQITLSVFGGKDLKILFDVRTQIYRDGQLASVQDLKPGERISIETVLDGTAVFARSIHMLTQWPGGESQGQVEYFNRGTGELMLRDSLAPEALKLHITPATTIVGVGQQTASAADLGAGALVSVKFQSDGTGRGAIREIQVLAAPGADFLFNGTVSFLDMHSGLLVLVDPRDQKHYEISFNSSLPGSGNLREGVDVTVNAGFDGTRYSAKTLDVHSANQ
jgi:hypothetical protein